MNVLGPIKKVSISSFAVESIARDIAALHNVYFDHSVFLDNEAKFFIKEFEGKRGDKDLQALRQCSELLGSTNALIDSSAMLSSKFLDEFNQKVQEISGVISLQMPKEGLHHEERGLERRMHAAAEDEDRRTADQAAAQRRATVDHNFTVHSQLFRDKYAFEPLPPASTSSAPPSSTPPSSAPTTPRAAGNPPMPTLPTAQTETQSSEFLMYTR